MELIEAEARSHIKLIENQQNQRKLSGALFNKLRYGSRRTKASKSYTQVEEDRLNNKRGRKHKIAQMKTISIWRLMIMSRR